MAAQTLRVEPVTAAIGAVISGVDLRRPLADATFDRIRAALAAHQVLFFHDQDLDEEQHRAFARRFGPLGKDALAQLIHDPRDLMYIEDTPDKPPGGADKWHTDLGWLAEPPSLGMLNARIIPPHGGDTLWASLFACYDQLSPAMQAFCSGLKVVNRAQGGFLQSAIRTVGPEGVAKVHEAFPPVEHPLVRTHPVSGRPALFLTATMEQIVGLTRAESDALIAYFRTLLEDPNIQVRWRWTQYDFAIWDQASTNHRALRDHYPQHRKMRRCTIEGARPFYREGAWAPKSALAG
jgi:taurine dioxygenase